MTPEIERLLGGYATNTLSEAERRLLYQAALEDQDLFNALEDEQALRDLLGHEESRRELARALRPAPAKPRRLWIWGLAAATAAAALALVVVFRPTPPPVLSARSQEIATAAPGVEVSQSLSAPIAPNRIAPRKKAKATPSSSVEVTVNAQAAAPMIPAPQTAAARTLAGAGVGGTSPAPVAPAVNGFRPTAVTLGQIAPPVPYVILRIAPDGATAELKPSDNLPAGDSIQLKLRPDLAGTLTVAELSAGSLKALPAGAPILVDRQKLIRVEWVSSTMSIPQTTF